ncbi:C-type lectin domain family 4 member G isoform X4 [Pan paniscus]|uniref:C-type lectin domain family 4 member G isoform X4 n=1 Tax=Pan paniscus TaxID=9597 RepID=UPI00155FF77A
MDTTRYSKWGGSSEEVPGASTERAALLDGHDLLRTNASKQTAALGALKEEVGDCHSCCSGTQALLQTTRAELGEAQAKLMEQESALRELRERVTQGLAEAGRGREDVRTELFRALEAVRLQNNSCEPCPTSWLSFEGSCYFFSVPKTTWAAAQGHCADASAHLVIVGGLDEQGFLTRNTRGRGYWLGLRAVRHLGKVQGYQWVDGVSLSFSHWNKGEPNDAWGRENCVMMLHTGLWNDAPCDSEKDGWICEKRRNC